MSNKKSASTDKTVPVKTSAETQQQAAVPALPKDALQKKVEIIGQWAVLAQVADACELPRATITDAAEKGAVWLQKVAGKSKAGAVKYRNPVRIREFDQGIDTGDVVLVNYNPKVLAAEAGVPSLISDQVNYSVWNKPSGVLSQGSKWSDHTTITRQVEVVHSKRAFLVHRLDRAASGLMVIAHTKNAVVALTDLFAKRKVEKTYCAIVHGEYKEIVPQLIELPVEDKPAHTEIISATIDKSAKTSKAAPVLTTLVVKIQTGRKHQIRSHLSSVGYPVAGDRLFDPERTHDRDLQLTCIGLSFDCPFTHKTLTFELPD